MEGLLRKYKISKISDNVKLTDNEQKICEFLDKTFVGLTRYDIEIEDLTLTYYINSDNVWIFDTVHHNGYIYLNSLLIKPFFDNLRFDDYKGVIYQ